MRIYISGPITGTNDAKSRFDAAVRIIRKAGHIAVNPYFTGWILPDGKHTEYMAMSFRIMEFCEAIYLMPGWEQSKGAMMEFRKARACGMTIYTDPEKIPRIKGRSGE